MGEPFLSIYQGRTGLMDYDDVHEAPVASKASVPVPSSVSSAGSQDWLWHRKAKPVDCLLPLSARWFGRLPLDAYPRELATQYPRIVNLIASQWDDHDACSAYFSELLVDRRGARKGFPAGVLHELLKLHAHLYSRERAPEE